MALWRHARESDASFARREEWVREKCPREMLAAAALTEDGMRALNEESWRATLTPGDIAPARARESWKIIADHMRAAKRMGW